MKLRIIAGRLGGRTISSAGRTSTHAMSERGRNSLFNILGTEIIQNVKVLDCFAGSGALGLEAISRGAGSCIFVEKDRVAAKILQENIDTLAVTECRVVRATVASWESTTKDASFDIIFADPPYHDLQFSTVKKLFRLLKPGGTMVLSHTGKGEVPIQDGIVVVDNRSYGNLNLTFFCKVTDL
jgi:16S rRNA (guanine966-N2)-methyltransferase